LPITVTDPVEVVDDPDFTVIIVQMIEDVVLFHVRADVLFHLLTVVFLELFVFGVNAGVYSRSVVVVSPELQRALQWKYSLSRDVRIVHFIHLLYMNKHNK